MTSIMMATARRRKRNPPGLDPDLYQRLITDRTVKWFLADVERELAVGDAAVSKYRRRGKVEGGHGPVGLPEPDGYDPPGRGTLPRPWWWPGTIRHHAIQVGAMSPDGRAQRPKKPGKEAVPQARRSGRR